jgi:hypothetical protein
MMCTQQRWLTMVAAAIVSMMGVGSAFAATPYLWHVGDVQSLSDVTLGFSGGQSLSTINSITKIPTGIKMDVTYIVGQNSDPFGADFGQTFARIALLGSGTPFDFSAFSGTQWKVTSDLPITMQDFMQTGWTETGAANVAGPDNDGDATFPESFSFNFWEHNTGITPNTPTDEVDSFFDGTQSQFSGTWNKPNPQNLVGANNIQQYGVQIGLFSGISFGTHVHGTITIEGVHVPEPGTLTLAGLAAVGMIGFARRRSR